MEVFGDLFNDLTGWLTIGILIFMIGMMAFLTNMIIKKSRGDGS